MMNTLISAYSLLLLASAAILGLICIHRIRHAQQQQAGKANNPLETQVNSLRLSKMLDKLGVPRDGYFNYMSPNIIQGHIKRCTRCTNSSKVHICDAFLDRGKPMKSMRFCPNYRSLMAQSQAFYDREKVSKH